MLCCFQKNNHLYLLLRFPVLKCVGHLHGGILLWTYQKSYFSWAKASFTLCLGAWHSLDAGIQRNHWHHRGNARSNPGTHLLRGATCSGVDGFWDVGAISFF
jgi:hypothetical protein